MLKETKNTKNMIRISAEKEYESLRQEILKRIEFGHTITNIILTVSAAFLGLGNSNSKLIFLLPIILLAIGIIGRQNSNNLAIISSFIKEKYEGEDSELSWETFSKKKNWLKIGRLQFSGNLALLILLILISLLLGFNSFTHSKIEIVLLSIDILILCILIILFLKKMLEFK